MRLSTLLPQSRVDFCPADQRSDVLIYGWSTRVENLTELCLKTNARLIHISTVSVGGSVEEENKDKMILREDMLDIGQEVEDNAYVYTKYLAEKHVLKCIEEKNLDAKIIRVGNLSSRVRDGEFQVNFRTNAFMNSLKAYAVLGCFPMSSMSEKNDLSYVDETARAIITLSGTSSCFTLFHAFNSHVVEMGDELICVLFISCLNGRI